MNLTIGYQKGGIGFYSSPSRHFNITVSGSAGMKRIVKWLRLNTRCLLCPSCTESSDYWIVFSVSQAQIIPLTVLLLNDGVAAEPVETLTLILTETFERDRFENEFLFGRVDIRIRDINSVCCSIHGMVCCI